VGSTSHLQNSLLQTIYALASTFKIHIKVLASLPGTCLIFEKNLLVFVLAAFGWTKSLLCNVAAFTGMLLYPESTLQLCSSRRFCEVFKDVYFGSLSAVRMM
jgi:hypothetical protein